MSLSAFLITGRQSIVGSAYGSPQEVEDCIQFSKLQGVKCMIETFPLNKLPEAYARRESARFRCVVKMT